MKELVITIFETSEGEYQYDIYDSVQVVEEGGESIDGGVCTTTIENALEMAQELAKEILARFK